MKTLYSWLSQPVGTDIYGTSSLTMGQLIGAIFLVVVFFAWCAREDYKERQREKIHG